MGFGRSSRRTARDPTVRHRAHGDLEAGGLTREKAKPILAMGFVKMNGPKMRTLQSLTAGGNTLDGEEATNHLPQLVFKVMGTPRLPYPNASVRVSGTSPDWIYDKIAAPTPDAALEAEFPISNSPELKRLP